MLVDPKNSDWASFDINSRQRILINRKHICAIRTESQETLLVCTLNGSYTVTATMKEVSDWLSA